jgi:hypothetical protein
MKQSNNKYEPWSEVKKPKAKGRLAQCAKANRNAKKRIGPSELVKAAIEAGEEPMNLI